MELSDNGSLTILLTDAELGRFGLRFEQLDYAVPATRLAIHSLLDDARRNLGFDCSGSLLIEALPTDTGCLLLVTPAGARRRIRMKRAAGPLVYRFADVDALFSMAEAWNRAVRCGTQTRTVREKAVRRGDWVSSLYLSPDGYRLILDEPPAGALPLLEEFGQWIGEGALGAAHTAEHGVPLAVGDAMPRLCAAILNAKC